jgi:hypothetical protein
MEFNSSLSVTAGKIEIFPTSVMVVDQSAVITTEMKAAMIRDIDRMVEETTYLQNDDRTPDWQCKPVLWNEQITTGSHWQMLKQTFMDACLIYNEQVENYVKNQSQLLPTHARAWFYKSYRKINVKENPWHNHAPSYLTGVFYLQIPGDGTQGGTELTDPRGVIGTVRDVVLEPRSLTWVIFPGWLYHRAQRLDTDEPRYTIAADLYVMAP